jgi:hypothetical protein
VTRAHAPRQGGRRLAQLVLQQWRLAVAVEAARQMHKAWSWQGERLQCRLHPPGGGWVRRIWLGGALARWRHATWPGGHATGQNDASLSLAHPVFHAKCDGH